jgi:phage regulator Rha-like protein
MVTDRFDEMEKEVLQVLLAKAEAARTMAAIGARRKTA